MFRRAVQSVKRAALKTAAGGIVAVGTLEVTTHLPSQGRSSAVYHYVSDEWITPAMRALLDPEGKCVRRIMCVFSVCLFATTVPLPVAYPKNKQQIQNKCLLTLFPVGTSW